MTNGNDAAFSTPTIYGPDEDRPSMIARYEDGEPGLTKREHFAAMAMQGLLANPDRDVMDYGNYSNDAVMHADALIDALNKEAK